MKSRKACSKAEREVNNEYIQKEMGNKITISFVNICFCYGDGNEY